MGAPSRRGSCAIGHTRYPVGNCSVAVAAGRRRPTSAPRSTLHEDLVSLVSALDGIQQSPRYHPEGDALYHSLQVFQLAQRESADRVMWAAALFHDVGKAIDGPSHDEVGADLLEGLLPPRAVWLVRHHLDLMKDPRRTRRRYGELPIMRELQQLRRWDERGRDPKARVMSLHQALDALYAGQPRELFLDLDGTFDPEER